MKVITVSGWKGGVAKTTTCIHLATYLAASGKVILVDGDPNRSALSWAERGRLPFTCLDQRRALKLALGADFLVIDSPARPESEDLKEMSVGSHLIILPIAPDVLSLEPTLKMAQELAGANYKTLVTLAPPPPNHDGEQYRQELQDAGVPVFETTIRRTISFPQAALQGCTVRDLHNERAQAAWRDYVALGKEILEELSHA